MLDEQLANPDRRLVQAFLNVSHNFIRHQMTAFRTAGERAAYSQCRARGRMELTMSFARALC